MRRHTREYIDIEMVTVITRYFLRCHTPLRRLLRRLRHYAITPPITRRAAAMPICCRRRQLDVDYYLMRGFDADFRLRC